MLAKRSLENGFSIPSIQIDKAYTFDINYASDTTGKIVIKDASGKQLATFSLNSTGGNEIWKTVSAKGINLKKGENKIRIYFESEGINLKYFEVK
ncbi:carbohydrate-binding protein [Chryseobacterium arachidis]|uniref:carbohydrate-binding protein n=1 Tax=Chryseobacterium arachidis TaxID=1416778 RepID=UPI00361D3702